MGRSTVYRVTTGTVGVILAGGQATRLQVQDGKTLLPEGGKAFLTIDGVPLIERTIDLFAQVFDRTIIVTNSSGEHSHLPVDIVTDRVPGKGPVAGLVAAFDETGDEDIFLVGCDMPFLELEPIRAMIDIHTAGGETVLTIPKIDGNLEPLHAIYGRACAPVAGKLLADATRKAALHVLTAQVPTRYVNARELGIESGSQLFQNINTPDDIEKLRVVGSMVSIRKVQAC